MFGFRERFFGQKKEPPQEREANVNKITGIMVDVDTVEIIDNQGYETTLNDVVLIDFGSPSQYSYQIETMKYDITQKMLDISFDEPVRVTVIEKDYEGRVIKVHTS